MTQGAGGQDPFALIEMPGDVGEVTGVDVNQYLSTRHGIRLTGGRDRVNAR